MNKKIKNILLCHASGMGIKSIASAFHISFWRGMGEGTLRKERTDARMGGEIEEASLKFVAETKCH